MPYYPSKSTYPRSISKKDLSPININTSKGKKGLLDSYSNKTKDILQAIAKVFSKPPVVRGWSLKTTSGTVTLYGYPASMPVYPFLKDFFTHNPPPRENLLKSLDDSIVSLSAALNRMGILTVENLYSALRDKQIKQRDLPNEAQPLFVRLRTDKVRFIPYSPKIVATIDIFSKAGFDNKRVANKLNEFDKVLRATLFTGDRIDTTKLNDLFSKGKEVERKKLERALLSALNIPILAVFPEIITNDHLMDVLAHERLFTFKDALKNKGTKVDPSMIHILKKIPGIAAERKMYKDYIESMYGFATTYYQLKNRFEGAQKKAPEPKKDITYDLGEFYIKDKSRRYHVYLTVTKDGGRVIRWIDPQGKEGNTTTLSKFIGAVISGYKMGQKTYGGTRRAPTSKPSNKKMSFDEFERRLQNAGQASSGGDTYTRPLKNVFRS